MCSQYLLRSFYFCHLILGRQYHCVVNADLTLASLSLPSAEIIGVSHHALIIFFPNSIV